MLKKRQAREEARAIRANQLELKAVEVFYSYNKFTTKI